MALTKVTYSMIDGASANVTDFGATGDGITDDTVAIQAAIDSGVASVYFPEGTYLVTGLDVTSPIKLYGNGELYKNAVSSDAILYITSDDVEIDGLTFTGAGAGSIIATTNINDNAIYLEGGDTTTQLNNFKVTNCKIDGFAGFGVWIRYCENVWVENNKIQYCGYAGILLTSVVNGFVNSNSVYYIDSNSSTTGDYYGISLSRDPTKPEANAARTVDVIVSGNVIANVNKWTGIDGHASYKCQIVNNAVYSCYNGIVLQYDSSTATYKLPCDDIVVSGNIVSGRTTTAENQIGISSLGLSSMPNRQIVITENVTFNCGNGLGSNIGAFHVEHSNNVLVANNVAEKSRQEAITVTGTCDSVVVKNNIFNGVKNGLSDRYYAYFDAPTITNSRVSDNVFVNNTGDTAYNPQAGILYTGVSTGIVFSRNKIKNLVTPVYIGNVTSGLNLEYAELLWELEPVSVFNNTWTLTAGNTTETFDVDLPRNVYGTVVSGTIAPCLNRTFLVAGSYKVQLIPTSLVDANTYRITAYTTDGATFGSAFLVPFSLTVFGLCFD